MATEAEPLNVRTWVDALYEPVMPFWFANPSTSPAKNPLDIVTVAPARFALSASLTVIPESIVTGVACSEYPTVFPALASAGAASLLPDNATSRSSNCANSTFVSVVVALVAMFCTR